MENDGADLPGCGTTKHHKMLSRGYEKYWPQEGHLLSLATSHSLEAPAAGSHLFAMASELSSW